MHEYISLLDLLEYEDGAVMLCYHVFFFQAEDGIRDLVRSRGLGDVYKRQILHLVILHGQVGKLEIFYILIGSYHTVQRIVVTLQDFQCLLPVSYTHLTLPTSDLV